MEYDFGDRLLEPGYHELFEFTCDSMRKVGMRISMTFYSDSALYNERLIGELFINGERVRYSRFEERIMQDGNTTNMTIGPVNIQGGDKLELMLATQSNTSIMFKQFRLKLV